MYSTWRCSVWWARCCTGYNSCSRRAPAPEIAEAAHAEPPAGPRDLDEKLEDIERTELMLALARAGGNKAEMARQLGMQRTTLYYRLKKLGIET